MVVQEVPVVLQEVPVVVQEKILNKRFYLHNINTKFAFKRLVLVLEQNLTIVFVFCFILEQNLTIVIVFVLFLSKT